MSIKEEYHKKRSPLKNQEKQTGKIFHLLKNNSQLPVSSWNFRFEMILAKHSSDFCELFNVLKSVTLFTYLLTASNEISCMHCSWLSSSSRAVDPCQLAHKLFCHKQRTYMVRESMKFENE